MKIMAFVGSPRKGSNTDLLIDQVIAGAVYFLFRDTVIFKYGAFNKHYQILRPNNLVMWETIRWCCTNGFHHFSLGRTDPDNEGLLQFKRGWAVRENKIR